VVLPGDYDQKRFTLFSFVKPTFSVGARMLLIKRKLFFFPRDRGLRKRIFPSHVTFLAFNEFPAYFIVILPSWFEYYEGMP